jgi:hypothetical protein
MLVSISPDTGISLSTARTRGRLFALELLADVVTTQSLSREFVSPTSAAANRK